MSETDIEWIKTILGEIKTDIRDIYEKMNAQNQATVIDLATLKTKAGIWGTLGGLLSGALVALMAWLQGRS